MFAGSRLWLLLEPERGVRPPDAAALALTAAANLTLALRGRLPVAVLLVTTTAAIGFHLLGCHYGLNDMGPLVALYTVAGRVPAVVTGLGGVLVASERRHPAGTRLGGGSHPHVRRDR